MDYYYWIKSYFTTATDNIVKVHYIIGNTSEITNLVNCGVRSSFNFCSRCYGSYSCANQVSNVNIAYKAKSKLGVLISLTGVCADLRQIYNPTFNTTMVTMPLSLFCRTGATKILAGAAVNLLIH